MAKEAVKKRELNAIGFVRHSVDRHDVPVAIRRLAGKRVEVCTDGSDGRHGSDKTVYMIRARIVGAVDGDWILLGLAAIDFGDPDDRGRFFGHLRAKHPVPLGHPRNPEKPAAAMPSKQEGATEDVWLGGMHHPSVTTHRVNA